jgi:hypothetical protein
MSSLSAALASVRNGRSTSRTRRRLDQVVVSVARAVTAGEGSGSCKSGKDESRDDFELHIVCFLCCSAKDWVLRIIWMKKVGKPRGFLNFQKSYGRRSRMARVNESPGGNRLESLNATHPAAFAWVIMASSTESQFQAVAYWFQSE